MKKIRNIFLLLFSEKRRTDMNIKTFKNRIISVLLIISLMVPVMACGGGKEAGKVVKIGVCVYDQYDTFLTQLLNCFNDLIESDVTVEYVYASQSQTTQNEQVESLIEKGVDVLCVNLVDRTSPTTIIDLARKNDVPIIFFNRELVEEDLMQWSKLYYIGADAFQSGIMQGDMAAVLCRRYKDKIDKNGDGIIQFVVLEGEAGHQDSIVRTEYSINTMIEKGEEVEKVGYAIANWNRAQAQTQMTLLMEKNSNIELVLANNDDMALGAIDAYEKAGYFQSRWPAIFGIDGTDVGLQAVSEGKLWGTVYNDKEGQAKAMYDLAVALAKNQSLDDIGLVDNKYIRTPYTEVTEGNVGNYLKDNK